MMRATLPRLQIRMVREINRCITMLNMGNLVYITLKREQISQRYFRLMQAANRRS